MSNSGIVKGDLYIVKPKTNYITGDVIAFKRNGNVWFHEIIEVVDNDTFITKGSSNSWNDGPVDKIDIVGYKCSNINLKLLNNKTFKISVIVLAYLLMIYLIVNSIFKIIDENEKDNEKKDEPDNQSKSKKKVEVYYIYSKHKYILLIALMTTILSANVINVFCSNNETILGQIDFGLCYIAQNKKPEAHITENGTVVNENGENNGLIISELSVTDTWEVVGYTGTSDTLVIPENIISIPMWRGVFDGSKNENAQNLKTIILPESINSLDVLTFANLPELETLVIRGGTVPWGLINNCPNLKTVYIGANVNMNNHAAFINANCDFNELKVYCEPNSKPSSWDNDWDVYIWNQGSIPPTRVNTVWGVAY